MYSLLREMLFCFPPEKVHHFSMNALQKLGRLPMARKVLADSFTYNHPSLIRNCMGLSFRNPVGLGAGFDKNALYLPELAALGFGFVEIGTVTPQPQMGNPTPRLFRLPADKALINRMGFNNDGMKTIANRLMHPSVLEIRSSMLVGGNIGKNKITPNEEAWKDYVLCFETLFEGVDYFVVNVSSPNTPGLRALQEKDALKKILGSLQDINQGKKNPKPLMLKVAPDLGKEQLDEIVELAHEVRLSGIVATNTTIQRKGLVSKATLQQEVGGLSGKPVQQMSTEVVQHLAEASNHQLTIVASGGIFTGADAQEKLDAGASMVQVWTGFVYEGPAIAKHICQYLVVQSQTKS